MAASRPPVGPILRRLLDVVLDPRPDPAVEAAIAARARETAPVIWLVGKVQAGKTSIVRAVTGARDAEIGHAFKPCTRASRIYEFPEDAPVVRFLDTRGLGEVAEDPADELALLEQHAHAVVAVVRAMDPQQRQVLEVIEGVRRRHPDWAVVMAQTRLHDAYPDDRDHPPYGAWEHDPSLDDLRRSLAVQRRWLDDLPGDGPVRAVAVDLTRSEDGFGDPDYGLEPLLDALDEACSVGHAVRLKELSWAARDSRLARAHPHVLGYAMAAAVTDLVPVMGFVTVPTLQGKMLHSLARIYRVDWDRGRLTEFVTSLGSGTALGIGASFAARQLVKLIPVYGQLAGAAAAGAASGAVTYALGRAACFYLDRLEHGRTDPAGVARTYRGALKEAWAIFRETEPSRRGGAPGRGEGGR